VLKLCGPGTIVTRRYRDRRRSIEEEPMFKGSFVALITPFRKGEVDETAFQELVAWQLGQGTHGLVPCGTTGESPALSEAEHDRVIHLCVEVAKGKAPVIAGTGTNSTERTIAATRHAKAAGADAALVVCPYYNKPTQEGLYQHYKAINDAVDLPIIIYNIPGRSAVDMSNATMARLALLPNIVGVKDATNDLARPLRMRREIGASFALMSGEDATAVAYLSQGGDGCISVTANVAPRLCAEMHEAWQKGEVATVRAINERLIPLHDALFAETSPAPVKYAASLLGKSTAEVRQPLWAIMPETQEKVRSAMRGAGLIN
jgi:4-hydroxy-tetrahydrodipicolinate synthase